MGKGSRNRINREVEPKKKAQKNTRKYRKPLSGTVKGIIAAAVCLVVVVAIVFGSLVSNGTFKRNNILVKSQTGKYDIDQQMATYMVWDALYYTAYYQWNYLSETIQEQTGITSQSQYCLYYAMSGVQDTLKSSINNYASTLKEYVAVCDIADSLGFTLTKEEKKTAKDEAESQISYMATMNSLNTQGFLNYFIGNQVKMKDIQAVAEMQALYSKVVENKQEQVEASVTEEILNKYRDANPESFYSTDYLTFSTQDTAVKEALLAVNSVNAFKAVLVRDTFENGENNYKLIFNKYATTLSDDANAVLTAIEKKENVDALNTALTEQGMTATEYSKSDESLNSTLSSWMFDSARKQLDTATVATADAYYVVALTSAPADGKVNAAVKVFTLESGDSYQYTVGEGDDAQTKTDNEFKTNMLNTLLKELDLLDSAEGLTLYQNSGVEAIESILTDLVKEAQEVIPEVKNTAYVKEPTEGSYQEWMFKDVTESFGSPVAVGAVNSFTETKDDKETYNIYIIVEPMKLDTESLIDGGYLIFDGDDHATAAQNFLNSLSGLAIDAIAEKLQAESDATVSETISEDSVTAEELSTWLFSAERASGDTALIPVADTAPDDDTENESCTYVAFYRGSQPSWKASAKSGYTSETLQDWVDELISQYELTGMKRIKDRNPVETETSTTASDTAETTAPVTE